MSRQAGQELRQTVMPKKFDGTGVVRFQASEGVFNRMKMSEMPAPTNWGTIVDGRRYVTPTPRTMPADSVRYRVIWPERVGGPDSVFSTGSFSLGGNHSNQTLFVLAQFLRDQGVEFIGLANKNGSRFKDVRLNGL